MAAKGNGLKTSGQLKFRFKNLPQAETLKKSVSYNQKVKIFSYMLGERKKIISEKINKINLSNNSLFLSNLKFKADLNVLNLVNVSSFSKTTLYDYIRVVNGKHSLKLKLDINQDPRIFLNEIYKSGKISLEERVALRFLSNFNSKSTSLSSKYKEYIFLTNKQLDNNLNKLKKDLLKKEIADLKSSKVNSRNSSRDAKEAKEAEKEIKEYYANLFEKSKNDFLENKKKLEKLSSEIISLLPEVIASADLIEYISKQKFIESYKK